MFLYEIDNKIDSFGYNADPRIKELRQGRNMEQDMLTIFEATSDQIAHTPSEINQNTKAYVGQLEPGIFTKLPATLEHVYTSFPERKIRRENVEVGDRTAEQFITEMKSENINISTYAESMLMNKEQFIPTKDPEEMTLVRLTVADLGFTDTATTNQIYQRAEELGLELCPPDTGPHYRLKYKDQPLGELFRIGMKQITASGANPDVFSLGHYDGGLWLYHDWADPDNSWRPDYEWCFRLRKSES